MAEFFWYALTSSNINRFSKLFHCQNQEKTCNKERADELNSETKLSSPSDSIE